MILDRPFDRQLRRLRRKRAGRRVHCANYLHLHAAEELAHRLGAVRRTFRDVLVLGGASELVPLLDSGTTLVSAGPGSGQVVCDEDLLPFADASFDLVLSIGALDSVNDLPGALALSRRALRPDGLFLGAMSGAGSLPRLRAAMLAADDTQHGSAAARIHPQIDVRAAGDLLTRAGFVLPVSDGETVQVRFSSLQSLVNDLRSMGATNMLAGPRLPLHRKGLEAAVQAFKSEAAPDGKTEERFDILYLTGWSPGPEQPQAARRGSAIASLATALKSRI
jgi:NADH dehydrogenase [ubiquinone] 1 alpha subcomplex assembly factor 5